MSNGAGPGCDRRRSRNRHSSAVRDRYGDHNYFCEEARCGTGRSCSGHGNCQICLRHSGRAAAVVKRRAHPHLASSRDPVHPQALRYGPDLCIGHNRECLRCIGGDPVLAMEDED